MYINIYVHTSVICTMHSWTLRYLMMCSFLKPKYQKVSACKAFSSNYNVLFMLPLSFQILLSNSWWCIYCTKFPESSGNRLINVFGGQNGSLKNLKASACKAFSGDYKSAFISPVSFLHQKLWAMMLQWYSNVTRIFHCLTYKCQLCSIAKWIPLRRYVMSYAVN